MSEYLFGLHSGHLDDDQVAPIEVAHGVTHVNHTEPHGEARGWWAGPNRGEPFDGALAWAVAVSIEAHGGLDALRVLNEADVSTREVL